MNSLSNLLNLAGTNDAAMPATAALPVAPAALPDIAALSMPVPMPALFAEGLPQAPAPVPADFSFANAMQIESLNGEALPASMPTVTTVTTVIATVPEQAPPVAEDGDEAGPIDLPPALLSLLGLPPPVQVPQTSQTPQAQPLPVAETPKVAGMDKAVPALSPAARHETAPPALAVTAPLQAAAAAAPRHPAPQAEGREPATSPARADMGLVPAPRSHKAEPPVLAAAAALLASAGRPATASPADKGRDLASAMPAAAPGFSAWLNSDTQAIPAAQVPALRLPNGDSQQWQSPLLQALGDRIQLQIAARSEQANIRLEPPQMGRVEIAIRQEAGGALEVRLSASHGEVQRQLKQVGEHLRMDLMQRHGGDVQVQVGPTASTGGGAAARDSGDARQNGQQQQRQARESEIPGRGLATDEGAAPFVLA